MLIEITIHSRTQISISTQTYICNLPPKRTITHKGCNTTPKLKRDRDTQFAPIMTSRGVLPHCVFINEPPVADFDSESSSPATPDFNISRFFIEEYEVKKEESGLPRCRATRADHSKGPPTLPSVIRNS